MPKCPSVGGPPRVAMDSTGFWNLTAGQRTRIYLLDRPKPILVILEAPSQAEFDHAVPDVDAMRSSLRFPE